MNTVPELIEKLELEGIRLKANGERLRVESASPLSPEIRDTLKGRKQEILNHLALAPSLVKTSKPFLDENNDLVIPVRKSS